MMGESIYVASSWRNPEQPKVVEHLRANGHEVYDFRNPEPGDTGFSWRQCNPTWKSGEAVTAEQLASTLTHPVAKRGFEHDFRGMRGSWACVLALPCGRSAHLEAGWFTGKGRTLVVYAPQPIEPELMYLLGGDVAIVSTLDGVVAALAKARATPAPPFAVGEKVDADRGWGAGWEPATIEGCKHLERDVWVIDVAPDSGGYMSLAWPHPHVRKREATP